MRFAIAIIALLTAASVSQADTVSLSSLSLPLAKAQELLLKPNDTFKECEECPEMVVIPAGSFLMGAPEDEKGRFNYEGPQHLVTLAQPFAIGRFEVTVDEFAAFVNETGYLEGPSCWTSDGKIEDREKLSWRNPGYQQNGSHPAACLSWNDAKAYVAWLSEKTSRNYRLLSETEWEYAARAGSKTRFYFGDDDQNAICEHANLADQTSRKMRFLSSNIDNYFPSCSDGNLYTAPVGRFLPNAFGLYDMLGNVREWVEDCFATAGYLNAPSDGSAWTWSACRSHVLRGGSFSTFSRSLRVANRYWDLNDHRSYDVGLRVARALITP
jgi:formylglycine-generating enzyme required for sulfatase activity